MYLNTKWILKLTLAAFVLLGVASVASAQIQAFSQSLLPPDEARDIFIAGQRSYDEGRFTDAENRFREVIRRFPKNQIADRADYYLIRTLAQTGKRTEALSLIDTFAKQYPKSSWQNDVGGCAASVSSATLRCWHGSSSLQSRHSAARSCAAAYCCQLA